MAKKVAELTAEIGVDLTDFEKGLKKLKKDLGSFGKNVLGKIGKTMKVGFAAASAAFVAGITTSIVAAAGFDKAMREVNTLLNLSEEEFKAFSGEVLQLSSDMGIDAVQATEAIYQALSAGVPKENVLDFLRIASKTAIGGVTDTKTAVDGLTNILTPFRLSMDQATKVADSMFATMKIGKLTVGELSDALNVVAPTAANAGVNFQEMLGAMAQITLSGTPVSKAANQVRVAIQAILAPTDEAAALLKTLGIQTGKAAFEGRTLVEVFEDIKVKAQGNEAALRKLLGSEEALGAIYQTTGVNAESAAKSIDLVKNSAGAAQTAYEEMRKSLSAKFNALKVRINNIAIQIGQALLPKVEELVTAFDNWFKAAEGAQTRTREFVDFIEFNFLPALETIFFMLNGLVKVGDFLLKSIKWIWDLPKTLWKIYDAMLQMFNLISKASFLDRIGDIAEALMRIYNVGWGGSGAMSAGMPTPPSIFGGPSAPSTGGGGVPRRGDLDIFQSSGGGSGGGITIIVNAAAADAREVAARVGDEMARLVRDGLLARGLRPAT